MKTKFWVVTFLTLLCIVCIAPRVVYGAIPVAERQALIDLYNATAGDGWASNSGWKTPPLYSDGFAMPGTENTWIGITITSDHVTEIILNSNWLTGSIPSSLENLTFLQTLDLAENQLSGVIPLSLGNLSQLFQLNLQENNLSGNIPSTLGNLTRLNTLYLFNNNLSGNIPPELGNLTQLEFLILGINQLSGSIPTELGNLLNLRLLHIGKNNLTGNIPTFLSNLVKLEVLELSDNQFGGNIPSFLGNLTQLELLNLQNSSLTGSIPASLGNLNRLVNLNLSHNNLSGNIPTSFGNLTNLMTMDMSFNQLSGNIPCEFGNLNTLDFLQLSSNQLSGSIPSELGNLTNLFSLRLENNQLSGSIPTALGNLSIMMDFNLSYNKLSGEIPMSIKNLDSIMDCSGVCLFDIRYNCGFIVTDPQLRAYLDNKNPGWETQQNQCNPGSLTLLSPNGGERWEVGSTHQISWNSSNLTGNVRIDYTTDNGTTSWTAIMYSTPINSSYNWLVPDTVSTQCKIRVTSLNPEGISDESDNTFSIYKEIASPQRAALIALYNATNGDNWTRNYGWKTPPLHIDGFAMPGTENSWYGISFAANNVYQINLQNNNLTGILPDIFADLFGLHFLYLNNNNLTGNIPASIGTVTTLEDIKLNNNRLTGSIPSSFNALSMLQYLDLSSNQLSGDSLPDLSSLSNFHGLNLSRNSFTFPIPSWIGSLTGLTYVDFSNNLMTGNIPSQIGNLSNLRFLNLSSNAIEGEIPTMLSQLQNLTPYSEFGNNALYTDNAALVTFMDQRDPDWKDTQTVAPRNVIVSSVTGTTVTLNWDAISFTDKSGGYDVYVSSTAGGSYTKFGSTSNKLITTKTVTGLQPATPYYFVVKARTEFDTNRIVISGNSEEVPAITAPF